MAQYRNLDVYHQSQQQVRDIAGVRGCSSFGDLANQMRRAAVSVVSNLVEGAGRGNDKEYARFLCIARASNDELAAQLEIVGNIAGADVGALITRNVSIGRQLSGLIRYLRGGG